MNGNTPGTKISLDEFYVAKSDVDNADTMNAALARGKHLLLTSGIYNIDKPIKVTNPNTVVLGIGLATLNATNGNDCIDVEDVDGVSISGILLDAGSSESETLLKVGDEKTGVSHADNPITISDVYFRIGGAHLGKAATSLVVNSNDVIEVPELDSVVIHNACSVMLAGHPVITPSSGFYNADKTIEITTGTEGAEIYYTTDGTIPSRTNGTLYTGPFKVTTGVNNIKAISVKKGKTDSYVSSEEIVVGNILLGKEAIASTQQGGDTAAKAIDGNLSTRWQLVFKEDPSWLQVDLGKEYNLDSFTITWQNAAAKVWAFQVSNDGENWADVFTEENGKAGAVITGQKIDNEEAVRYVRVYGTERTASNYGYSIYEFAVYGTPEDGQILCDAPDRVKGTAGDDFVTISWDVVEGASGYNVYITKWKTNPKSQKVKYYGKWSKRKSVRIK